MLGCISSLFNLTASNECLGWLIPAIIALAGVIYYVFCWAWKHTLYKNKNFSINFINHLPSQRAPHDSIIALSSIFTRGTHYLILRIISHHGFPVKKINLRCFNVDGTNIGRNIVRMVDIADPYFDALARSDDGAWGIDGEFVNARVLAKGEGFYLRVTFEAIQEWSGLLSFRAQDDQGFRSYGRMPLEIKDGGIPPSPTQPLSRTLATPTSVLIQPPNQGRG